jgi:NAD-dependent deacetylase
VSESSLIIPQCLIEKLRAARYVAVLTGAGISAESGLPTFRDAMTGLWAQYRPEDLATPQAFRRNPKLVWDWYAWRRELVTNAAPNPGHVALVELAQRVPKLTLITQNVDSLHQRAGSTGVIELHGNLSRVKCFEDNSIVETWTDSGDAPPHCPRCNGFLRPDVVWFGEALPADALNDAVAVAASCDMFFSIGTSGLVEPAASLPRVAQQFGATVVFINLDVTSSSSASLYNINGPAGKVLPALVRAAWPE